VTTFIDDTLLPTVEELDALILDDDIYIQSSFGQYIRFQQFENNLESDNNGCFLNEGFHYD